MCVLELLHLLVEYQVQEHQPFEVGRCGVHVQTDAELENRCVLRVGYCGLRVQPSQRHPQ